MLMKCPYCGKEISDKSVSCVHCGAKLSDSKNATAQTTHKNKVIILIAVILVALVATVGLLIFKNDGKTSKKEEMCQSDKSIITEEFAKKVNGFDEISCAHFPDHSVAFFSGDSTNPVACVRKNKLYGLINLQGDLVVPPIYEAPIEPMVYNNHVAIVKKAGKYGVLNLTDFSEVVSCSFDNDWNDIAVAIKNERLWLQKNGKYGLCDNNGKMLSDYLYSDKNSPSNSNEVCPVCKNGTWGFITKNGVELSSTFIYKRIYDDGSLADGVGYFTGEYKEDKYVALDQAGNVIPENDYNNWRLKMGKKECMMWSVKSMVAKEENLDIKGITIKKVSLG